MNTSMPLQSPFTRPALSHARGWLAAGRKVAVATVIETWGSAPRQAGSHLVVSEDGNFEGSVSGGCVEGAVVLEAQAAIQDGKHRILEYGVSDAMAWEVGLACGGRIRIFVQPVCDDGFPEVLLQRAVDEPLSGHVVVLMTNLKTGLTAVSEKPADAKTSLDDTVFYNSYFPPLRLALIGAVHISQALAPMAQQLDYAVQVIDPRSRFASAERFKSIAVNTAWPDEALAEWKLDARTAVVALSHDPKLDDPALIAALRTPAFYIAALGSRKTHAARVERLLGQGFTEAEINRIHGPAGLSIGALTPAEIAVSVLAQMTAKLRQK